MTLTNFDSTKIICTLGPSSSGPEIIEQLALHGMAVARLNFSHGTHDFHRQLITRIRKVSRKLNQPIAILQDLSGPKIRVGSIVDGAVRIETGSTLTVVGHDVVGNSQIISASPANLIPDLKPGDLVFIDDGMIRLEVIASGHREIKARVIKGGLLKEHKGINLPQATLSLPSLTKKDIVDLAFGLEHGVDWIALSFVRSAADVNQLKKEIAKRGYDTPVIAKLEKPQAIKKLTEIVEAADAIMVARGDLGVEMPLDEVPIIQKTIITTANEMHKPVITATQMLESMTQNLTPTRAEVSDVANAILDGADCVMLSGETASGLYPVETVAQMSRIIHTTEDRMNRRFEPVFDFIGRPACEFPVAIAEAAISMAKEIDARFITCFTQSGLSARLVSKQKSPIPIIAFTPHRAILNRLALLRGVI
ncbi:MAG: pyruvate kinase, partial [Candidatus Zixiibacteriota bacterium]